MLLVWSSQAPAQVQKSFSIINHPFMHYQDGQDRNQMFVTSMEEMVAADSWARIVDLFVDSMSLGDFGFMNMELNKEGNIPYHPSDLCKFVLYGYRKRIRSSLKLSEACKIDVEVMWLLKGLRPSQYTINYFRSNNGPANRKSP